MSKKTSKMWAIVKKESGEICAVVQSRGNAREIKTPEEKIVRCSVKLD